MISKNEKRAKEWIVIKKKFIKHKLDEIYGRNQYQSSLTGTIMYNLSGLINRNYISIICMSKNILYSFHFFPFERIFNSTYLLKQITFGKMRQMMYLNFVYFN